MPISPAATVKSEEKVPDKVKYISGKISSKSAKPVKNKTKKTKKVTIINSNSSSLKTKSFGEVGIKDTSLF